MEKPQRDLIRDDLKGLVRGECLFDDLSRVLYSTDASIFQVTPLGVVAPLDEADLQAIVRYAGDHGVPLIARGAGSGLAGESLGSGLVVDLSRHFRSIVDVGTDTVRVQPGVVLRDLNARLARDGRRFAPDPSSSAQCTIGGMLATDASGATALRHGYTRSHVASLRVVLDTGEAVQIGRQPRWAPAALRPGRLEDIVSSVATLLEQNRDVIAANQPRTPFSRCGYHLQDVLNGDHVDLARLLVGSEGTLAVFSEATLRTVPLPGGRALVLLSFASLEAALAVAHDSLQEGPVACELMDRRLLSLTRSASPEVAAMVPPGAEAVVLVEFEDEGPTGVRKAALDLIRRVRSGRQPILHSEVATEPEAIRRVWRLREAALPSLFGLRGGSQPVAFIEDVGVPPEELSGFVHRVQDILQGHETTASFLIHVGTGQVHARPFLNLSRAEDAAKLAYIADAVYAVALSLGGTISSQHGTGLARTPWVARQFGALYPLFREVKAIFDPRHLLNPGKIVAKDVDLAAWPLRHRPVQSLTSGSPSLIWRVDPLHRESDRCNGCGQCRTDEPEKRMCPVFRTSHAEAASPRSKANLLRHLLDQGGDVSALGAEDVRAVADLCVNCKMCAVECPAQVNIPKMMLEAKAANVTRHGLDRADWAMARTEGFARLGSGFAALTNLCLGSRSFRWLLERLFGVSRRRRVPRFAGRNFLRRARRRGWTRKPRPGHPCVAYFVDVFATYNDPLIAEATVAVLRHNGIEVYVPPGQRGCGMAPLAYGDVETARETVEHNLHLLAETAREGYPIVCSEPTAALMLRHDAQDLIDDPDAALVAEHTVELTAFLEDLHRRGELKTDFQSLPFSVGHHVPCHLKALSRPAAAPSLLALIPDFRVHTVDVGCSGMAGTFGLQARNYSLSLEAGQPMLQQVARPSVQFGSTECSTCRMQMEDGAGKRTLHPVQYLALAYGYLPELYRRLHEPIRDLVL